MSKVKKGAKKASVRNLKPAQKKRERVVARKGSVKVAKRGGKKVAKKSVKKAVKRAAATKRRAQPPKPPAAEFVIKPLDPIQKCGPGTSVELLFKVVERMDGRATNHLVFLDRHGWYCEHGRVCPAVAHARKHKGQLARAS